MASRHRPRDLGTRLSIPIISVAVVLVGALQYGWFSRAADVEIDGAERALRGTVYQTLSREFQRYAPLVGDLKELLARDPSDTGDLKAFLEREYLLYGPSGTSPKLIRSAELFVGASAGVLFEPSSGTWETGARAFPSQVQARLAGSDAGTGFVFWDIEAAPSGEGSPGGYLYVSSGGPSPRAIALGIDAEGFFEEYLRPAIASVLPEARIEWSEWKSDSKDARSKDKDSPPSRSFNPIWVLLGLSTERTRTFAVTVPTSFGSFFRVEPDRDQEAEAASAQSARLSVPEGPPPRNAPGSRVALVTMPSSSSIGSIERRLALNWLLGTGLLIGLGTALVMTILQKRRLSLARQREREFVAAVTHELRTPVTAIRSAADNIRRGLVSGERLASYGEMIHNEALRLGDMVEEVILSSRVEARTPVPPSLLRVDAQEFLEALRKPIDAIAQAEGVRTSWDFGAMPKSFACEPESLRLMISNLATNAIYHAYSGEEKGDVRVLGRSILPSSLRFVVEDDGRGIAKNDQGLVFEAFYRDDTSRRRAEKGSGLGLYIARRKARELGGELTLESPYRRVDGSRKPGCRFVLEIPAREDSDAR